MPSESPWNPVRTRRATTISICVAVLLHVGILAWVSVTRASQREARPPSAQGFGTNAGAPNVEAGLPMTKARNKHTFRVISEVDGKPLAGARVTDLFANAEVFADPDGVAELLVRPGAKLVVHVEKPGFKLRAAQVANLEREASYTIMLAQGQIPYRVIDTLFLKHCGYCHGTVGSTENLDFTTYERLMTSKFGGKFVVRPSNPDSSRLVQTLIDSIGSDGRRTRHGRVTSQVTAFDIETFAEWIRQGAHGPEKRTPAGKGRP